MSFFVQRGTIKKTGYHTATLVERMTHPDGNMEVEVATGIGMTELDAAVSLDVAVQGMRAAAQLNYVRAKEQEADRRDREEALQALLVGVGDDREPEGNN